MIEILTMLFPTILLLIGFVLFVDLYLLFRRYVKLKIEKLKKDK